MHHASAPSTPGTPSVVVRPPSRKGSSAPPGVDTGSSIRRTAIERPVIRVGLLEGGQDGVEPTDAYVRRFWIPLLGPGAVADLLRLTAAARNGRPLKLPVHTAALARAGLLHSVARHRFAVANTVPRLTTDQARRLPPPLRRDHTAVASDTRGTSEYPARRGRPLRDLR